MNDPSRIQSDRLAGDVDDILAALQSPSILTEPDPLLEATQSEHHEALLTLGGQGSQELIGGSAEVPKMNDGILLSPDYHHSPEDIDADSRETLKGSPVSSGRGSVSTSSDEPGTEQSIYSGSL